LTAAPAPSLFAIPAAAGADARLRLHHGWLERVEALAEDLERQGRDEDAVAAAAIGGSALMFGHPGVLVSPRLERLFARVGARALTPVARERPPQAPPKRILHVATELYRTGGHTRVMWRWIARDRPRRHDVVATHQMAPLPAGLEEAVRGSGGRFHALPTRAPLLRRAQRVRALAAEADLVVLHSHPSDPMPTVALAGVADRPPVVFNDHAANVFWFGRAVADMVLLALDHFPPLARRGVPPERIAGVPFPVRGSDGHGRDPSKPMSPAARTAARRAVLRDQDWPDDTVLLFTAGDAYKYVGPPGTGLLDLVEPVLARHPRARLLAAGPEPDERWARSGERTGGRVRALGKRSGIDVLFAAADIYLDSYPFGGNGTAGEAASHGLPVIALAMTAYEGEMCRALPVFGCHQEPDLERYQRRLDALIDQPAERERLGEASRAAVAAHDARWHDGIKALYARAAELGPVGALPDPDPAPTPVDRLVDLQNEATGMTPGAETVEPMLAVLELMARHAETARLFAPLCRPAWLPSLERRAAAAFSVPPAEPELLRTLIADFATLAGAGAAERFVIAMRPEDAGAAVPVLETALAEHPELTVDLLLEAEPRAAQPPGALVLEPTRRVVVAPGG
jgi:glycosyltransferase involved in cell wall biosynthesis